MCSTRIRLLCLLAVLTGACRVQAQQGQPRGVGAPAGQQVQSLSPPPVDGGGNPFSYQRLDPGAPNNNIIYLPDNPPPQPGPPPASNFVYQRPSSHPTSIYANGMPPAVFVGPQAMVVYVPPPSPPPVPEDPYSPYRYDVVQPMPSGAGQLIPPVVIRRLEPTYMGPSQLDDPIPFHRCCKETFWLSADYLAAFLRPMRTPPLLTSGFAGDPAPQGALGKPSTTVIFGNNNIDLGLYSGMRLEAGVYLDEKNHYSLDWRGFLLFTRSQTTSFDSNADGTPLYGRPIIFSSDPANPEHVALVSFPNGIAGNISFATRSMLGGVELNGRYHEYWGERLHVDALFGLRYMRLKESLAINQSTAPLGPNEVTFLGNPVDGPQTVSIQDSFATSNQFFGPQIGGRMSYEHRWFTVDTFLKLGVGATVEQATIAGSSTLYSPAGNQTVAGGILALPSNIGSYNRTTLGFIPEFGLNFGIDLTSHLRFNFGYTGMAWSRVLRPAGQIDRTVNPGQIPVFGGFGTVAGPIAPAYRFNDEFFMMHSFNMGLELHF